MIKVIDLGVLDDQYNHFCLHVYKNINKDEYYIYNVIDDNGVDVKVIDGKGKGRVENVVKLPDYLCPPKTMN
jgi:hypothetical protein